jgi:hypothetical protein
MGSKNTCTMGGRAAERRLLYIYTMQWRRMFETWANVDVFIGFLEYRKTPATCATSSDDVDACISLYYDQGSAQLGLFCPRVR